MQSYANIVNPPKLVTGVTQATCPLQLSTECLWSLDRRGQWGSMWPLWGEGLNARAQLKFPNYVSYPRGRPYCSIQWILTAYFGPSSVLGTGDSWPKFEGFHGGNEIWRPKQVAGRCNTFEN